MSNRSGPKHQVYGMQLDGLQTVGLEDNGTFVVYLEYTVHPVLLDIAFALMHKEGALHLQQAVQPV